MYGGGFATIPAYLADVFGSQMVGAIHGRLLTARSAAGISGPVLVNYLREYQLAQGVEPARIYDITLLALTGLLIIGFICNQLVRPIPQKYAMTAEQQQQARGLYTINKDAQLSWGTDARAAAADAKLAGRRYTLAVGNGHHLATSGEVLYVDPQRQAPKGQVGCLLHSYYQ